MTRLRLAIPSSGSSALRLEKLTTRRRGDAALVPPASDVDPTGLRAARGIVNALIASCVIWPVLIWLAWLIFH